MYLTHLRLKNFRNYQKVYVEFSETLNELYGDNAQGKTNLLEALYVAMTGRSFRTAKLTDLIYVGSDSFFIEVGFVKHEIHQTISVAVSHTEKRVMHNHTPLPSFSHLLGLIQGVLFVPSDQQLITGSPAMRRRFFDLHLAQLSPKYTHALSRYYRAMKQRNALLKARQTQTIEAWEQEMNETADVIFSMRTQLIKELEPLAAAFQKELSHDHDKLTLRYESRSYETTFREALERHRPKEMELGHTLIGPHRDDLGIFLQDQAAKQFGSEGQLRSSAMSLRVAEWHRIKKQSQELPIKLVDDVGATLDPWRKERLYAQLKKEGQTFLTSPRPLSEESGPRRFHISAGTITAYETFPVT